MKNIMKGLIIFFSVLLITLLGLMTYALVNGSDELPLIGGIYSNLAEAKLINTQTISPEGAENIKIKNSSYDIIFMDSDSEEIVVKEYSSKSKQKSFVTVDKSGNTLNITSNKKNVRSWFVLRSNYAYYEVYLPASYKDAVDIETSSGDFSAETNLEFSDFNVNSSSGYVNLNNLRAGNIYIKTSSGDIRTEYLDGPAELSSSSGYIEIGDVAGDIKIRTSSGDVDTGQIDGTVDISCTSGYVTVAGGGDTQIQTSSGDIGIENITGRLNIKTSSGYVEAEDIEGGGVLTSTSGDIRIDFTALTENLQIETSSGYVYCKIPQDTSFKFQANTSSGDINTDFDDALGYNKKGNAASGQIGSLSDYKVTINTSSGDVNMSYR